MLVIIDDRRRLSEENTVVRGNDRGFGATVDAQTIRIHELETEVLDGGKKTEAPCEWF